MLRMMSAHDATAKAMLYGSARHHAEHDGYRTHDSYDEHDDLANELAFTQQLDHLGRVFRE